MSRKPFDCVLSDDKLPAMDGVQFLAAIPEDVRVHERPGFTQVLVGGVGVIPPTPRQLTQSTVTATLECLSSAAPA